MNNFEHLPFLVYASLSSMSLLPTYQASMDLILESLMYGSGDGVESLPTSLQIIDIPFECIYPRHSVVTTTSEPPTDTPLKSSTEHSYVSIVNKQLRHGLKPISKAGVGLDFQHINCHLFKTSPDKFLSRTDLLGSDGVAVGLFCRTIHVQG